MIFFFQICEIPRWVGDYAHIGLRQIWPRGRKRTPEMKEKGPAFPINKGLVLPII
jgi:hypothetical protein